ncbi:MAG: hypothetical protein IT233_13865 [Bacteroidia bacterium]|nr:hypothetical protein [Bacteroidia bacterium]
MCQLPLVRFFFILLLTGSQFLFAQSCPSWGSGYKHKSVSVIQNPFGRERKPGKTFHGDYFTSKRKKKTSHREQDSFKKKSRKKRKSYGEKAKGKKVIKSKKEKRKERRTKRKEMKKSRKELNWEKDPLSGKPKKQKKKRKRKPEVGLWDQKMY